MVSLILLDGSHVGLPAGEKMAGGGNKLKEIRLIRRIKGERKTLFISEKDIEGTGCINK